MSLEKAHKTPERYLAKCRARYASDPEKYKAYQRAYVAANRETVAIRRRAFHAANRENLNARTRAWNATHPGYKRDGRLKAQYDLTPAAFDALLVAQEGRCKICRVPFTPDSRETRPSVDHCHTTRQVRGLLCGPCNKGIGFLKDDPAILAAAIAYLTGNA